MPQLSALALSLGLGFQASLCPPGMDMGMEMAMLSGGAPSSAADQRVGHRAGLHCLFDGSTNEAGESTCPFAINGIGPCGTTVPVPAVSAAARTPILSSRLALVFELSGHTDAASQVPLPPPRA